jgi:hypothetical protein
MNMYVITVAMIWRLFTFKVFYALSDNIITVSMVMLLNEAFTYLCATLWKRCTETKGSSLIIGLLCTYMYLYITQDNMFHN